MKRLFLAALLVLAACGSPAKVGETVNLGVGKSATLLARHNGWEVWKTRYASVKTCIAVKPQVGGQYPAIYPGVSNVWSPIGSGVYITWSSLTGASAYVWGAHTENIHWVMEVDGEVYTSLSNLTDDALSIIDGKMARFEVTSRQYTYVPSRAWVSTGTMDLTGFAEAVNLVGQCEFSKG